MIVIFGGTGTLGHALAKVIKEQDLPCTIVSRCEERQQKMKAKFPLFRYVVGDITKTDWMLNLPTENVDMVFNLAAMKHVDIGEHNVQRCVDVNYNGTINTYLYAKNVGANGYYFSSTDKAVLPWNAYGMAKGLGEKFLYERVHNDRGERPLIGIYKWGNVLGSRGSVLHKFKHSLLTARTLYITNPEMTRFWIHIDDVAKFMWKMRLRETSSEAHIPPMKASTVERLGDAVAHHFDIETYDKCFTGIRAGEKIHECLKTGHDYCMTSETHEHYTDKELRDLVARAFDDTASGQQGQHGWPVRLDTQVFG